MSHTMKLAERLIVARLRDMDHGEAPWSSGRALALHAARPRSIPGLGGENY